MENNADYLRTSHGGFPDLSQPDDILHHIGKLSHHGNLYFRVTLQPGLGD